MNEPKTIIESNQYLQAILESAPYTIIATDCDGLIKMFNHHAEKELQYSASEMIDLSTPEIFHLKSEIIERSNVLTKDLGYSVKPGFDVFVEKIRNGGVDEQEWTYVRKDGASFSALLSITAVKDNVGNTVGYMAISRDMSERRNFERKIEEAKQHAEQANEAKSLFLANMSHEIRTPMNAVLGFSEMLQSMEDDPKKLLYINMIHSSGRALLSLINDILDLSKIEAGKFELQYGAASIRNLFTEIQALFSQNIEDKGLQFTIDIAEKIPETLVLDEARLRQVLINLLGNSIKFTKKGSINLCFSCCPTESAGQSRVDLTIIVADTGIGIPGDQCNSVFDAFVQTKGQKQESYGGTGLGLAITRRLVDMMGGAITVDSELGHGSTFTVFLPGVEIVTAHDVRGDATGDDLSLLCFEPATILIADDIDYNREILTAYLSSQPFKLIYAENGREVLKQVRENHPDLILLDMKMPVMDGYETAQILGEAPETTAIPIIAVTASALTQDEEVIRQNCDEYLRKPVSKTDVLGVLKKYLGYEEACKEQRPEPCVERSVSTIEQKQDANKSLQDNLRVLVAEDNEVNRLIIKNMLETFDIDPLIANNGAEAVKLVQQCLSETKTAIVPFDLILMDCEMPEMNGFQATEKIRILEAGTIQEKSIPIIALSAHTEDEVKQQLQHSGMDAYLEKPLTLNKLSELLKHYFSSATNF